MGPDTNASPGRTQQTSVPLHHSIALFFLLACINALVAKYAIISFGMAPGVSALYVVVALMVVFTLWFGMYGAVAAYAGCFIGAGLFGSIPPGVNLYWSLADFWQVMIPLLAFRFFACDPGMKSWRDGGVLLVFGVLLNNLAGAAWGSVSLALGGIVPWSGVPLVFYSWLAGNVVVCIVFVPVTLYFLTPFLRDHELFVRKYWH